MNHSNWLFIKSANKLQHRKLTRWRLRFSTVQGVMQYLGSYMGKREENKARNELDKSLEKELRVCIKKTGWKKNQSTLFKVDSSYFFHSTFILCLENRISFTIYVKPYEVDNIFWDIMDMEINKNEPLSLRYNGAFVCSSLPFSEYDLIYTNHSPQELAHEMLDWTEKNIQQFVSTNISVPFSESIKKLSRGSYAETLICSLIYEEKYIEAKKLSQSIVSKEIPISGDYITKSVSFFEHARNWLEKHA